MAANIKLINGVLYAKEGNDWIPVVEEIDPNLEDIHQCVSFGRFHDPAQTCFMKELRIKQWGHE